jgi:M6 family metalloprotease-like protein
MTARSLYLAIAVAAATFAAVGSHAQHLDVRVQAADCAPPRLPERGTGEGLNDPRLFPPTVGELRIAVLFVDFADVRGASDPRALAQTYLPRVAEWYRTVSYGRLRLVIDSLPRWLTLSNAVASYAGEYERGLRATVSEVVAAADPQFAFDDYDSLYLIVPARVRETMLLGVHIAEEPIRIESSAIRSWVWLYEDLYEFGNYAIHETGHVLGLPDLYVGTSPRSFHAWDVMASSLSRPAGMFAWHRWKLGWLDRAQIACMTRQRRVAATLRPLEQPGGIKAIVVPGARSAYVAEVRQPVLEDSGICRSGVLVYRVMFGEPAGSADIFLLRAQPDTPTTARCGPQAAAPFGTGRGRVSRVEVGRLRFEVATALRGGAYRVVVTRR